MKMNTNVFIGLFLCLMLGFTGQNLNAQVVTSVFGETGRIKNEGTGQLQLEAPSSHVRIFGSDGDINASLRVTDAVNSTFTVGHFSKVVTLGGNTDHDLQFGGFAADLSAFTPRMTINTNGDVTAEGNINLTTGTDKSIGIPADNNGEFTAGLRDLTIRAGGRISSSSSTSVGGNLILRAGNANIGSNPVNKSNNVMIYAGDNVFAGTNGSSFNGDISFFAGNNLPERLRIVGDNGNVGIGTTTDLSHRLNINAPNNDALFLIGNKSLGMGARITFGDDVTARAYIETDAPGNSAQMNIKASNGIRFLDEVITERFIETGGDVYPRTDDTYDLGNSSFSGRWDDVFATSGVVNTSDRKEKQNIKAMKYGIEEIMQLKPVQYEWIKHPEKGTKLGLIAQDVEKVVSEVVKTYDHKQNEEGKWERVDFDTWGIYYSDLIPVLIKGMQEQQVQIEAKDERIEALEARLAKIEALLSGKVELNTINAKITDASLQQNAPNPFTEATNISYFIPEGTKNASLQVMDQNGRIIKTIPIQATGKGQVTLQANLLSAGTYSYSLVLDGQVVETKQMVLTH